MGEKKSRRDDFKVVGSSNSGVWFLYIEMGKVAMGESLGSGVGVVG